MGKFLFKMERKYGKYAIQNLSLIMIICYAVGMAINYFFPAITGWLVLNPYLVLHGQVWRLFSWILIPPDAFSQTNIIFVLIMLYFYYSIGRSLENVWGDFKYNVYIFSGLIFTIIGAFILYGLAYITFADELKTGAVNAEALFTYTATINYSGQQVFALPGSWFYYISTYYICMSIFLAFAATFPNNRVLLFFIIPVRVSILGIIDGVYLAFSAIYYISQGAWYLSIIIVMSVLNFIIFYLTTKNYNGLKNDHSRVRRDFRRNMQSAKVNIGHDAVHEGKHVITRHKCAICGRTELDGDNLEFRFCSRCDGNYEYCSDHINMHEHVRRI